VSLTTKQLGKLELLYKRGEQIESICRRLHIAKATVRYHANRNGWKHGQSKKEYAKRSALMQKDNDVEDYVQTSENLKNSYISKITQLENMVNALLRGLGTTPEEIRQVPKAEADRIFAIMKNLKMASEISNLHYEATRRALGIDMQTQEEGPDLLPITINVVSDEPKGTDEEVESFEPYDKTAKEREEGDSL